MSIWYSRKHKEAYDKEQEAIQMKKELFKHLGYEISVASSKISSASESVFMTIEENGMMTESLFAKAQEMTAQNTTTYQSLAESLGVVDEVMQVIKQVEKATRHLETINDVANETIEQNLDTILSVVQVIEEIQEASQATKNYMALLNAATEEITQILNTVSSISKQTHLLALNASIESARAGEAGLGFAVVAEEIRKLSNHTSAAVQDVGRLVGTMKKSLQDVNTCVDDNVTKVEAGVSLSNEIGESLKQMQDSFEQVTACVTEIGYFSTQETGLALKMDTQIKKVSELSQLTAQNVETVCEAIEMQKNRMDELGELGKGLNQSAADLNGLIASHKLGDLSDIEQRDMSDYILLLNQIRISCTEQEAFVALNKEIHNQLLREQKKSYEFIEAIWTNSSKGRFIASIPAAGISNGNIREWFKEAVKGENYVSKPYISAITKNPCRTLSMPIQNKMGQIIGVIGMDVQVE